MKLVSVTCGGGGVDEGWDDGFPDRVDIETTV